MGLRFRYGAVLSDIDGTLLGPGGSITDQTRREIRRLDDGGIPFALVTGRMPAGVTPIEEELGMAVHRVCYSGALAVSADDRIISNTVLSPEQVCGVLDIFRHYPDLTPSYFAGFDWFVEDPSDPSVNHEVSVVKARPHQARFSSLVARGVMANKLYCNCTGHEGLSAPLAEEIARAFPELTVIRSARATMVEVLPPKVTKATGAQELLAYLGIDPKTAVAFGDDANDIALLSFVGCGVAVGNAVEQVKQVARAVAPAGRENGVARFLQGCWIQVNDRKVGTNGTT